MSQNPKKGVLVDPPKMSPWEELERAREHDLLAGSAPWKHFLALRDAHRTFTDPFLLEKWTDAENKIKYWIKYHANILAKLQDCDEILATEEDTARSRQFRLRAKWQKVHLEIDLDRAAMKSWRVIHQEVDLLVCLERIAIFEALFEHREAADLHSRYHLPMADS